MKDENRDGGRSPVDPSAPPELPEAQDEVGRFVGVLLHNRADTARMLEILEAAGDADLLQIVEVRLLAMGEGSIANMAGDRRKSILRSASAASGPQMEVMGEERQFLLCKLTVEEVADYSRRSLELHKQVNTDTEALKEVVAGRKAAIKSIKDDADDYGGRALSGLEGRGVTVIKYWDPAASQVVEVREDTGEEVARRVATPQESQTVLFQQTR